MDDTVRVTVEAFEDGFWQVKSVHPIECVDEAVATVMHRRAAFPCLTVRLTVDGYPLLEQFSDDDENAPGRDHRQPTLSTWFSLNNSDERIKRAAENRDFERAAFYGLVRGYIVDALMIRQGLIRAGVSEHFVMAMFHDFIPIKELSQRYPFEMGTVLELNGCTEFSGNSPGYLAIFLIRNMFHLSNLLRLEKHSRDPGSQVSEFEALVKESGLGMWARLERFSQILRREVQVAAAKIKKNPATADLLRMSYLNRIAALNAVRVLLLDRKWLEEPTQQHLDRIKKNLNESLAVISGLA